MITMPEANERIKTSFPWLFQSKWVYVGLGIYWMVAWLLPWESIGQWSWVADMVDIMASIVPSIRGLPSMIHFMGKPAAEAQLAFLHLCGLLFTLVVIIFTRPMLIKPKVKRKRLKVLMGVISFGFLVAFFSVIAHYVPVFNSHVKSPSEVFHDTGFKMVLVYVFAYWVYSYLLSVFVSFLYALFLPLEIEGDAK